MPYHKTIEKLEIKWTQHPPADMANDESFNERLVLIMRMQTITHNPWLSLAPIMFSASDPRFPPSASPALGPAASIARTTADGEEKKSGKGGPDEESEARQRRQPRRLFRLESTPISERSNGIPLSRRQLEGGRPREERGEEIPHGLLHRPRILRKRKRRRRER